MNSYELSRTWFNFCFDNPELIKPTHTAIYFMAIEHCNRLGWKEKFGFPSQMVMEAIGVKNWRTYSKALNELVEFGFIKMIEVSKNQYSSNIIALVINTKAPTKALDKALSKHLQKQGTKQGQSTVSIDKQETSNKEQLNKEQEEIVFPFESVDFLKAWNTWKDYKETEHKFKYKTATSEQAAVDKLSEIATTESLAIKTINESIAQGWKGLFKLNENGKQRTAIDTKTISDFDPDSYADFKGSGVSDTKGD